jgi:hypothetical protein
MSVSISLRSYAVRDALRQIVGPAMPARGRRLPVRRCQHGRGIENGRSDHVRTPQLEHLRGWNRNLAKMAIPNRPSIGLTPT